MRAGALRLIAALQLLGQNMQLVGSRSGAVMVFIRMVQRYQNHHPSVATWKSRIK
jgi:hypothetical protein